jgi:hypothetical protein
MATSGGPPGQTEKATPLPLGDVDETRRSPRYPANLRVQLGSENDQCETRTRMVSLSGFSVLLPDAFVALESPVVVHLPDQNLVRGRAQRVADRGASVFGFQLDLDVENLKRWAAFIESEAQRGGLWRLLGRYAGGHAGESGELGGMSQGGTLSALLTKMGLGRNDDLPETVMRLHMVGENLEAFRIAFDRFGGVVPGKSDLARTVPGFLEQAQCVVSLLLPGDVWLRLDDHSEMESLFVLEMLRGDFAYLRVEENLPVRIIGLTGAELIGVEMDGRPLFPFFTDDELWRITHDAFRRNSSSDQLPVVQGTATLYAEDSGTFTPYLQAEGRQDISLDELGEKVANAERVDTRFYGSNVIKLFPEVYLSVTQDPNSYLGFAMQDGVNLCVFALQGPHTPRVVKISEMDRIELLDKRPEDWIVPSTLSDSI